MDDLKNRGFLLISTVILIIVLISNLLLSYLIILRKGQRIETAISNSSIDAQVHNLQVLAYDELRRIDRAVLDGKVSSGSEYVGISEDGNRVWFGNSKKSYSKNNYFLNKLRYDNKNIYASATSTSNVDFKQLIERELRSAIEHDGIITVELLKKMSNDKDKELVVITAKVELEYHSGNKKPAFPDNETLKELVVNLEN